MGFLVLQSNTLHLSYEVSRDLRWITFDFI